jgi:hypothetical protein
MKKPFFAPESRQKSEPGDGVETQSGRKFPPALGVDAAKLDLVASS